MNLRSLRQVVIEIYAEWKAREEEERIIESEKNNWCGNNI